MLNSILVIVFTLIAAAIVAYAQYIFKRWVHKFNFSISGALSLLHNRKVVIGIFVYLIGLVFYLVALGSGQLSFIYPTFSSTFIFVMLISHFKLKEKIYYIRFAGLALIIIGILLVSYGL